MKPLISFGSKAFEYPESHTHLFFVESGVEFAGHVTTSHIVSADFQTWPDDIGHGEQDVPPPEVDPFGM